MKNYFSTYCLTIFALTISSGAICQTRGIAADFVMTESQPLGADNRIERTVVGDYAQDSEGRTRFRMENMTVITDPVEGLAWNVDNTNRVAFEYRVDAGVPPDGDSVRTDAWSNEFSVPERNWPEFNDDDLEAVDLGDRTVNGVECSGRKWTYSVPAGAIGNLNPIEVTTEVWKSSVFGFEIPIKITMQSPLSGTKTRELRRVRESDFDRTFFLPDPDYSRHEVLQ